MNGLTVEGHPSTAVFDSWNSGGNVDVEGQVTTSKISPSDKKLTLDGALTVNNDLAVAKIIPQGDKLTLDGDLSLWGCSELTCPESKGQVHAYNVWAANKLDSRNVSTNEIIRMSQQCCA